MVPGDVELRFVRVNGTEASRFSLRAGGRTTSPTRRLAYRFLWRWVAVVERAPLVGAMNDLASERVEISPVRANRSSIEFAESIKDRWAKWNCSVCRDEGGLTMAAAMDRRGTQARVADGRLDREPRAAGEAPPKDGASSVDHALIQTVIKLLAKSESTDSEHESIALVEKGYRMLAKVINDYDERSGNPNQTGLRRERRLLVERRRSNLPEVFKSIQTDENGVALIRYRHATEGDGSGGRAVDIST